MSQVRQHQTTHHHPRPHHTANSGHSPNPAQITNFAAQAMDQQMAIMQMQQAQMVQQLTAQVLQKLATPTAEQQAQYEKQAQEARLRQQQFEAWNAQQTARFEAINLSLQLSFQTGMQGMGQMETSLGGFLNQGFLPTQLSGVPSSPPMVTNSPLFSGPIAVPSFYQAARRFRF